jgi:8-oxo-dGTP pyrophosphatase MutT (NUDIX family)
MTSSGKTTAQEYRRIAHGVLVRYKKVLLVQRAGGRFWGGFWDVPGGAVEAGESTPQAVERQFLEETGIAVKAVQELARQTNVDGEGGSVRYFTVTYLVRSQEEKIPQVVLSPEHVAYEWVSIDAVSRPDVAWHVPLAVAALSLPRFHP